MRLALSSRRKSSCSVERPFTDIRTCVRVKSIMEVSVPTSGVKPFFGPTMVSDSLGSSVSTVVAAEEGSAKRLTPESPAAKAAVDFRKLRRVGQQSQGIMVGPFGLQQKSMGNREGWYSRSIARGKEQFVATIDLPVGLAVTEKEIDLLRERDG
jgi:hypothetical protein